MDAIYRYGPAQPVPYTAGADIPAGKVLIVGETLRISHQPILNGDEGTLYCGGGIYDVVSTGNYADGLHVYWNDTTKKITSTGAANLYFGIMVGAGTTDAVCRVQHLPAPPDTVGGS